MNYQDVLKFWFEELTPLQHFKKDAGVDAAIRERFYDLNLRAARGELASWRATAEGRLAEIILLDQFSRNLFRGEAIAFSNDPMALTLAQEAILWRYDRELSDKQAAFVYMPFMHSESALIQKQSVELFARIGSKENIKFAEAHRDIIERFGRFPHRNEILGRASTSEEIEFLKQPNSSF